jgi:hypothetical protein
MTLRVIDTGQYQHVLAEDDDSDWVYKIPAGWGYYLPYGGYGSRARVQPGWKAKIKRLVLRTGTGEYVGAGLSLLPSIHARYLRRQRLREFRRMIERLQLLPPSAEAVVVPFRVVPEVHLRVRWEEYEFVYSGPTLLQKRVTFLKPAHVTRIDPILFFEAHRALWDAGLGITEVPQVLGAAGWAFEGDRVLLGDTSSLSSRFKDVRRALIPSTLAAEESRFYRMVGPANCSDAHAFLSTLRRRLTIGSLERHWNGSHLLGPRHLGPHPRPEDGTELERKR